MLPLGILFLQIPATAAILYLYTYNSFWTFCDLDGWYRLFLSGLSPATAYYKHMTDLLNSVTISSGFSIIFITLAVVSSLAAFAAYHSGIGGKLRRIMITQGIVRVVKTAAVIVTFLGSFLYIGNENRIMGEGKTLLIMFGPGISTHIFLELFHHGIKFQRRFLYLKGIVCTLLIAALIAGTFWYDWLGFDHPPSKQSVVSYAIEIPQLDRFIYYGGRDGRYVLENMEVKNVEGLYRLLQSGEMLKPPYRMYGAVHKGNNYELNGMFVRYRLNNGRSITRFYYFNFTYDNPGSFYREQVYSEPDFKTGIYPILSANSSDITGIDYETYEGKIELVLSKEERAELLVLYQQDLRKLKYVECENEAPVASISFYGDNPKCFLEQKEAWHPLWLSRDVIETDFYHRSREYPVYLSFQGVRDFLQERGYFFGELDLNDIEMLVLDKGVDIYSFRVYTGEPATITDPDIIRKIMKKPVYKVYSWGVSYKNQIDHYLRATVRFMGDYGGDSEYLFEIDPKQVPEEVMDILIDPGIMY